MQADEFWGFIFKKEYNLTELEKIQENIGDCWTFTAINPETKLIFAHISGKRILENAIKLFHLIKKRVSSIISYITTDGNDMYTNAILSVLGHFDIEKDKTVAPDSLCYAQIIKKIEKGKCVKVEKRIIFGNEQMLESCLSKSIVSYTINTAFIERSNLTLRQHNHRVERKSQGFSKMREYFNYQTSLTISYYNFCLHHSSLLYYEGDKTIKNTPAMASGLTDHIWSMRELLSFH